MSTAPTQEPDPQVAQQGTVRFTARGEAALDALATALTARCSGTPQDIATVLDQVLHADIDQLAAALTEVSEACTSAEGVRPHRPETPDEAARRRLGRLRERPRPAAPSGRAHR